MRIKILIYTVSIFLIVLIQSSVLDYVEIFNVKPNLLLIFIVATALLRGNVEGAVIGFISGLSQDIVSGKLLGFYSLLGLYLGLIIGSVNKRLYRENFFLIIFFTFISTVVYEYIVYLLGIFFRGKGDLLYPFQNVIFPEAIYNCALSVFIFMIAIRMNRAFENANKMARKY